MYECKECLKTFREASTLRTHRFRNHRKVESIVLYQCAHCTHKTKNKNNLARHLTIHAPDHKNRLRNPQPLNVCSLCSTFESNDRKTMINHYVSAHHIQLCEQTLQFISFDEFVAWKQQTETKECCRFVLRDGRRKCKESSVSYFRCFRDGHFVSEGKGIRKPKVKGSCRIGGVCPASLRVAETKSTGVVIVNYIARHVGHTSDLGRMNLTQQEKEEIASQLSAGVSFETLLDSFRESICDGRLSRIHLTTRKDLWNIKSTLHRQNGFGAKKKDDRVSVEAWLATLGNCSDVVRFYKGQSSELPSYPQLNEEDFVLILSLKSQLEMLEKFGNDCVCFESTHGAKGYAFELTTLLVKDDQDQGLPCAYMVSNRCDSQTMALFIGVLMNHVSSPVTPSVIMSDTPDIYYNGWCAASPCADKPIRWLYCTWHVDRRWGESLTKIEDSTKRCTVYKMLRMLVDEPDEGAFSISLERVLNFLFGDSDLSKFAYYFCQEYFPHVKRWALCFRRDFINTNLFSESMQEILKYYYLDGEKVKRLGKGLIAILRFTRDKLVSRLIASKNGVLTRRLMAIRDRHNKSDTLKSSVAAKKNGWLISSESERNVYFVTKQNVICDCTLRCELCDICQHDFKCTCMDSRKSKICEHVHKLVTYIRDPSSPFDSSSVTPNLDVGDNELFVAEETEDNIEETIEEDIEENIEENIEASILNDPFPKSQGFQGSDNGFEEKKQALLRNVTRLIENTQTCAQLEVIEKAFLPLPQAIKALENR